MSMLKDRFARSAHINHVSVGIIGKVPITSMTDARDRLAAKATDYVTELHRSQLFLLDSQHYGSAAAMMRLVIEGTLSALYILHLPDEAHAIRLEAGEAFLPDASKMFTRCAKLPGIGRYIEQVRKSQSPFHKFTHGDMPQINRRTRPGDWKATFDKAEIVVFSIISDFLLLGAMDTYSHAVASPDLQRAIRAVRDENAAEARALGMQIPDDDTFSPSPIRNDKKGFETSQPAE